MAERRSRKSVAIPGWGVSVVLQSVRIRGRDLWEVVVEHDESGDQAPAYEIRWADREPAREAANRTWKRMTQARQRAA